jgi:hypothetical protein
MKIFQQFAAKMLQIGERRSPDFVIGGAEKPYLRRWWLIPRNRFFNIYLHNIMRSDDDRALHDHPWINLSILLRGAYVEHLPRGWKLRRAGQFVLRGPRSAHRLELITPEFYPNTSTLCPYLAGECWTLFITGPRLRTWGFHCPQGFVPWQAFTAPGATGEIGKGCNQ